MSSLLVAALLFAQLLGVVHRVAHAPLRVTAASAATDERSSWSKRLFDAHHGAGSCNLYDQLSQGAALPGCAAVWVASAATPGPLAAPQRVAWAAEPAAVRARGPPQRN